MNNQKLAINKINEIEQIIQNGNQIKFSAERFIINGLFIFCSPFVLIFFFIIRSDWKLFAYLNQDSYFALLYNNLNDFYKLYIRYGSKIDLLIDFLQVVGICAIIYLFLTKLVKHKKLVSNSHHPTIQRVAALQTPVLLSIVGICTGLVAIDQAELIPAVTLIILGLLFYLYGNFSRKLVKNISLSYMFLGLLSIVFLKTDNIIYTVYFVGESYLFIGLILFLENKNIHFQKR